MRKRYTIKTFHGVSDFSQLLPAWQKLLQKLKGYQFYHHPRWFSAVQRWLLDGQVSFVLIEENSEPVAVLPLVQVKRDAFIQSRSDFLSPKHDHISLFDLIVAPDTDLFRLMECVPDIVTTFGGKSWGKLSLYSMPESKAALITENRDYATVGESQMAFMSTLRHHGESAWFSVCHGETPVGSKLARNIRRLKKQASTDFPVEIESITDPHYLPAAYEKFLCVEASGWKSVKGTAILHDASLQGFYRELLATDIPGIKPRINLLWFGERVAAVQFTLQTDKCVSILKIAYEEAFSKYSPGSILLEALLKEYLNDESVNKVSLVTSPQWAERWHPNKTSLCNLTLYNNTSAGSTLRSLDNLRAIARTRLRELTTY